VGSEMCIRDSHIPQFEYFGDSSGVAMSEPNPPVPAQATQVQEPYHASSLVVPPRPDEVCFSLTEVEFQILCEGETSEPRAGRDLCIGACLTAVLGLISLLATLEWEIIWKEHRILPLVACAILVAVIAGCGVGWMIYQKRLTQTRKSSSYSRLRTRISEFFKSKAS